MFGTYRALLAILVVVLHYVRLNFIGQYAVFGFFVLSGYLMTFIMQNNYGYSLRGIVGYAVNRFLRIYPLYWFSCAVAALILLILGPLHTTRLNGFYAFPETSMGWMRNIFLFLEFNGPTTFIGPAWALTVELFFYLCIGLGLSRSGKTTLAWFVLSVAYTGYMVVTGADFVQRYATLGAASLPFATGALIYHWRDELKVRLPLLFTAGYAPAALFCLLLLNHAVMLLAGLAGSYGFYSNYMICALLVISLIGRKALPFIPHKLDNALGELSYPMYLIHYPLGFLFLYIYRYAGLEFTAPGPVAFLLFFPPLLVVSWAMAAGIERRVETLRTAVKTRLKA